MNFQSHHVSEHPRPLIQGWWLWVVRLAVVTPIILGFLLIHTSDAYVMAGVQMWGVMYFVIIVVLRLVLFRLFVQREHWGAYILLCSVPIFLAVFYYMWGSYLYLSYPALSVLVTSNVAWASLLLPYLSKYFYLKIFHTIGIIVVVGVVLGFVYAFLLDVHDKNKAKLYAENERRGEQIDVLNEKNFQLLKNKLNTVHTQPLESTLVYSDSVLGLRFNYPEDWGPVVKKEFTADCPDWIRSSEGCSAATLSFGGLGTDEPVPFLYIASNRFFDFGKDVDINWVGYKDGFYTPSECTDSSRCVNYENSGNVSMTAGRYADREEDADLYYERYRFDSFNPAYQKVLLSTMYLNDFGAQVESEFVDTVVRTITQSK